MFRVHFLFIPTLRIDIVVDSPDVVFNIHHPRPSDIQ